MDGWNTILSYWGVKRPIFRCVSGRVVVQLQGLKLRDVLMSTGWERFFVQNKSLGGLGVETERVPRVETERGMLGSL